MEFRNLLKRLVNSYFVIYGCCFFGTWIYCAIFDSAAVFGLGYFKDMAVFALLGDLPGALFYSSKELSKKQWNVRLLLHFLVLEMVLLIMARHLSLYHTALQGIVFAGIILLIYVLVRGICFAGDFEVARTINDRLQKMKKK